MHNGGVDTALTDPPRWSNNLHQIFLCIQIYVVRVWYLYISSVFLQRLLTFKKRKRWYFWYCVRWLRGVWTKSRYSLKVRDFQQGVERDELVIPRSRMLFVRMNNAWFTTIARRRKLCGGSSIVRRCALERIKGINQIHCCALSDERHGAEWMQNRFFTLSCRWCFSMHFYGEPISRWVQSYQMQGALLSVALGYIQWHSSWKEFLFLLPKTIHDWLFDRILFRIQFTFSDRLYQN